MSACAGGAKSTTSSTGSSGGTGGSSASSATGGTTGASSSAGSSTTSGNIDAGCPVGAPGGLQEGSTCLFPFDCACGLVCGNNSDATSGHLACAYPCAVDTDCPLAGEHCETTLGFCQGGLGGTCAAKGSANLEFYSCLTNADCPCPLECYPDPALGAVCERPCNSASGCSDGGEFCNLGIGSCQQSCNPDGLVTELKSCVGFTDCRCPLSCFQDPRRGQVCELPCRADSDCNISDEICEPDAGSCQRTTDCYGVGGGLPALSACVNLADCACPLSCVSDPLLSPSLADAGAYKFCELCDAGGCQSVPGSCQPQGDGGFQSSDTTPCRSNADCTCPARCMASIDLGVLRCERSCATSSDCEDPAQFCVNGQCVENYCDGQLACDLFAGRDDPPDAGNGTCLRLPPYTDYVCRMNGTANGACDPLASRSQPSGICPEDFTCVESFTNGFTCAQACAVKGDCSFGATCDTSFGLCFGVDAGASSCIDGAEPNDAGHCQLGDCSMPSTPGAFESSNDFLCALQDTCVCPDLCIANTGTVFAVCQQSCQRSDDCADPAQTCAGGLCVDNGCSGSSVLCNLNGKDSDGGQGTCLPLEFPESGFVCNAPGTASGPCSQEVSRGYASERCPVGSACLPVLDGGLGCIQACLAAGDCALGQTCVPSVVAGVGICLALNDAGTCALGQSSPPAAFACGGINNAPCGCGYACVSDACQQTCQKDSDCLLPFDICLGTPEQSFCVAGEN